MLTAMAWCGVALGVLVFIKEWRTPPDDERRLVQL